MRTALPTRRGIYAEVSRRVPAKVAAQLDQALPKLAGVQDEPFNGQVARAQLVQEVIRALPAIAIIETGTFRGATTEFFRRTGLPVYSVEANPRYYHFASRRFRDSSNVEVELSDSRSYLAELATRREVPKEKVLFYLDAHWTDDIPLRDEVRVVREHWRDSVVIVDDFQVPGDPGYGYDDYGAGGTFTLEYLADQLEGFFTVFYPSTPSEAETGRRRGCIVLASGAAVDIARESAALKAPAR